MLPKRLAVVVAIKSGFLAFPFHKLHFPSHEHSKHDYFACYLNEFPHPLSSLLGLVKEIALYYSVTLRINGHLLIEDSFNLKRKGAMDESASDLEQTVTK